MLVLKLIISSCRCSNSISTGFLFAGKKCVPAMASLASQDEQTWQEDHKKDNHHE